MSDKRGKQYHYLQPHDSEYPEERLQVELSTETDGIVNISIATMTSPSPTAEEIALRNQVFMFPSAARWLRDTLVSMNLDDWDYGESAERVAKA